MSTTGDPHARPPEQQPQRWPLCSDEDEFLYAESSHIIIRHSLPHRAVWGMLYSPAEHLWLIRRLDLVPGFWDISCGDHVLIADSRPETYTEAYIRALHETLGLETEWVEKAQAEHGEITLAANQVLSIDLGYAKEYNWTFTWERSLHLEREHVHMYLTIYNRDVSLVAGSGAAVMEWASARRIQDEVDASNCTSALAHTFARCQSFASQVTLRTPDAPP